MAHLQIRNVPADVHRKLRARAANTGQSLSEYALVELTRAVERDDELEGLASASPAWVDDADLATEPSHPMVDVNDLDEG